MAVLFYCASVIPGILRRLNVSGPLRLLQQVLLVYRRQTGIAMFIFATYHYLWSRGFQLIFTRAPLLPTTLAELAGSAALLLTMPLFLTSNDLSIKKMGQKWRLLHRLAYIIPLLISLHVLLLNSASITTVVLMVIIFAQISSWILFWRNSHVQSKM